MTITSAQAAKELKKLNEELSSLLKKEELSKVFLAASGEDPESLRPDYDYAETQKKCAELQKRIRTLKHALNVFNSTHTVPGFDMTVDEILIYIPQLTAHLRKLDEMKSRLPKMREENPMSRSNIIDYSYANYDVDLVSADYDRTSEELSRAQLALDSFNTTETFDVEF